MSPSVSLDALPWVASEWRPAGTSVARCEPMHTIARASGGAGTWPGRVQGGYYVATGVWPVLHYRSFEAITGPKHDDWLVKTFGLFIAVVGAELMRRSDAWMLGAGGATVLGAAEVVYVRRGRISPVYLLDAAASAVFVIGWWLTSRRRSDQRQQQRTQAARQRDTGRDPGPGGAVGGL